MALGRKQRETHESFRRALSLVPAFYPRERLDRKVDKAVGLIRFICRKRRTAFAWSGGKDSQVLELLCGMAGITNSMIGVCNLEYPDFLAWLEDNAPADMCTVNTGQDLDFLVAHPEMLFPNNGRASSKWYKMVQHRAQSIYVAQEGIDVLLLGRRRQDGNWVGRNGSAAYKHSDGSLRYSPIADWAHEDVLAAIHYYIGGIECMAPYYLWPRGFVVGSGPWAKRRVATHDQGWEELWIIDPTIVLTAAAKLPSARAWLERNPVNELM